MSRLLLIVLSVTLIWLCVAGQCLLLTWWLEAPPWLAGLVATGFCLFAIVLGLRPDWLTLGVAQQHATKPAWLRAMTEQLVNRLALPAVHLHVVHSAGINAFATCDIRMQGHVFLQHEVLSALTHDEVEAILAHELAHIQYQHALFLSLVQGVSLPVSLPLAGVLAAITHHRGQFGFWISLRSMNSRIAVLCFPALSLLALALTRRWEFVADRAAAELVGRDSYLHALRCLHGSFFQHPNRIPLSSKPAEAGRSWTHPDLSQRMRALQEVGH